MPTKRKRTASPPVTEYVSLADIFAPLLPPSWGLVNGKPFTRSLPDGKPVEMPESWKLPPELRGKPIQHHYTPVQRMGFPPGVRCWCGSVLEFNYHEPGQKVRRDAFFAEHEDCEPTEEVRCN